MYKIKGEEMILCPYNRCHVVKKIRIQKHILKCKKNYPEINLVTCIYNYSHRLKPENLLEHYEICRQKIRLDVTRYCERDDFPRIGSVKSERQSTPFPDISCGASILPEPEMIAQMDHCDSQQLDSSSSDSEMPECEDDHTQFYDDVDDNGSTDDLEPLPLPKTVSKAFVYFPKEQGNTQFCCVDDNDGNSDIEPLPLPKTKSKAFVYFPKEPGNNQFCCVDDNDGNSDIEPLPLPKTKSKAFACTQKEPEKFESAETSKPKGFGRGKNFILPSPPKPSQITVLSTPLASLERYSPDEKSKSSWFSSSYPNSCGESIRSSIFEDTNTLKSVDCIYNDSDSKSGVLKDLDKYVKK